MKCLTILAALLASAAIADDGEEGLMLLSNTNLLIVSSTHEEKAYLRQPVLVGPNNELIDDSGVLVSTAEAEELKVAVDEVKTISEAARVALTNSLNYLYSHTNQCASASQFFSLEFKPDEERDNLTAYVVQESTTGLIDTQWVWYNKQLALPPNRFVVYDYFGGSATNAVTWCDSATEKWIADGLTVNGYTGCHKCTVVRPTFAQNVTCVTDANDSFGGVLGFDFGSMQVTVDESATFTGTVTNEADGVWAYFDNGVLKEIGETE